MKSFVQSRSNKSSKQPLLQSAPSSRNLVNPRTLYSQTRIGRFNTAKAIDEMKQTSDERYRKLAENKVYTLSQNPEGRVQMSTASILQTLIASCHLLWAEEHSRWMTGRELLCAQGFPVYPHLVRQLSPGGHALCSFNASRVKHGLSARDHRHVTHQTGNSMH